MSKTHKYHVNSKRSIFLPWSHLKCYLKCHNGYKPFQSYIECDELAKKKKNLNKNNDQK